MRTRREWIFAGLIALAATALMQIPYALGYLLARPGTQYTGLLINIEDATYLVAIQQGIEGAWQYHIQFTTEPHSPAFLYFFYTLLGQVARLVHLSALDMWNLARVVAELVVFLVVFGFIAAFLRDPLQRRVAYLLAIFGSGFDWSLFPFESFELTGGAPVDFRIPDAHLFFTALTYPHLAIGTALLLLEFWLWLEALRSGKWKLVLLAGVVNIALGIIYPFLLFLVAGVLGTHWAWTVWQRRGLDWRQIVYPIVVFGMPAPLYAYYAYVQMTNVVFRTWNAQAITLSPNPLHYLLAYGAMLLLAVALLRSPAVTDLFSEQRGQDWTFLAIWIGIVAVLLYVPLNMQRRFVQGIQVPLSILATAGLCGVLLPRWQHSRIVSALIERRSYSWPGLQRLVIVLFLMVMSIGNWVVLLSLALTTAVGQPDGLFRPGTEMDAMVWLRKNTRPQAAVLADYVTGAFVPVAAGNPVFVGQRYETNQFEEKAATVAVFFNSDTKDNWRRQFLSDQGIRYVLVGERERHLGAFDPSSTNYLVQVYSNPGMSIYQFASESVQ